MEEKRIVQKLFSSNGKLLSFVMLLVIFLNSALSVFSNFCIRLPVYDFSFESSFADVNNPTSTEIVNFLLTMKDHLRLFIALQWIFYFTYYVTSLFSAAISILGASETYRGKDLSVKELLLRAVKSLKRGFVTWFYIKLVDLGYFLLVVVFLLPLMLIFNSAFTIFAFLIITITLAGLFRIYLAVVWELGLVVSVLEEKRGIEALGKAAHLIKGSKLRGFFLNLRVTFFSFMLVGLAMVGTIAVPENAKMVPFIVLSSIVCLIRTFLQMSYTVIYHECKETNGENLELQESMEYSYTKGTLSEFIPFLSADVQY